VPHRATAARIHDILHAIVRVAECVDGMTFEAFATDQRTIEAVQFNLIVIGEAARHVPDDVVARHPEVPWREMRGLRNVIARAYFSVSLPIVWTTITTDLPPLVGLLEPIATAESSQ
jgi:uncharacterized protein with HEPN domain